MTKKLAIGLGVLFVGLVAFGEVAYRKGWWVEPETEKIDVEITDEDLEALVTWGMAELAGRNENTLDQPPAEWEVQEQARAELDEYEIQDNGGAN